MRSEWVRPIPWFAHACAVEQMRMQVHFIIVRRISYDLTAGTTGKSKSSNPTCIFKPYLTRRYQRHGTSVLEVVATTNFARGFAMDPWRDGSVPLLAMSLSFSLR